MCVIQGASQTGSKNNLPFPIDCRSYFSHIKVPWGPPEEVWLRHSIPIDTNSSSLSLSHSNIQEVMSAKSVRAQGLRLYKRHWDWAKLYLWPKPLHTLHRTAALTQHSQEVLTLRPHPPSLSLTLQLVLRRPPLQQRQVAHDVLEKDHLGRRQGGALLGRRTPPQWQMLLRAAPLCWWTTQVFKATHSTHRSSTALCLLRWSQSKK